MTRYYDAERTDRYLAVLRMGFGDAISRGMSEARASSTPEIETLKSINSVLLTVQNELTHLAVEVPDRQDEEELVVEEKSVLDDSR